MKCPVDDETLLMTQRNGVEIDYCPKCRGVWLDRGELDKIIAQSVSEATPPVQLTPPLQTTPLSQYAVEQQSAAFSQPAPEPQYQPQHRDPYYDDRSRSDSRDGRYNDRRDERYEKRRRYDDDDDDYRYGRKRKKHESFLSELFDF
ncbi:MAG: zf-TFIIB domain-containing protein [Paracoccus sp. (in: a-proteobacteria)]